MIADTDFNAVTKVNNAIHWKDGAMGTDKQEITWRSCMREDFFSIGVQVPVNGVKRNCSLLQPKLLISRIL